MASNSVRKHVNCSNQKMEMILERVKAKLSTRDAEEQKKAIDWLENELNINSESGLDLLIETLLKSEIIALLCELIMTNLEDGLLVTSTLECLSRLTISEQFYRQNHASFVVASILRAGHFLTFPNNTKSKYHLETLESIARTLEKIFDGATNFQVSTNEIYESDQVLEYFQKIFALQSNTYRIVFSAAKILTVVLRSFNVATRLDLIVNVVETMLNIMKGIIEVKNPNDEKYAFRAIVMTCAISAAGITFCIQTNNPDSENLGTVNLIDCIYSSMVKTVIPNFKKIELDESNVQFYMWFVASLNGLYDMDNSKLIDLSNYLAEEGFLQTLPGLSTLQTENLRARTMSLVSRILTTLATVSLSAETWFGGLKQFQKFLLNAFKSLPEDPAAWLACLSEGDNRADALLILFYYNFLGESISNAAPYLPLIVDYVMSPTSSKRNRKPVTIQKALWFTFSFAAVAHAAPSQVRSYESAMIRLFKDLVSLDLAQCYTHHPALVVHCLQSTPVPNKIRAGVIYLWLENSGDVKCLLNSTVDGNFENYNCLLEMVKTGSHTAVDLAMNALSELVQNPKTLEALENLVWENLHQILAPGYKKDEYNTMRILKLTTMFEPKQISGTLLIRTLYQLINFILENESDQTLVSLSIKAAYCLLSLSINRNDVRGVTMFTNSPRIIQILKTLAFLRYNPALSHTSFRCLATLIRYQANYSVQCEDTLEIDAEDLLQQLYFDDCLGALNLLTALLTSKIKRPVIVMAGIFSCGTTCRDVINDIYLQLHVIHCKSGLKDRKLCYASLVGLLSYCITVKNFAVLKSLCELEWTFLLIEITIEGNQGGDPNFINFVTEWLSHRYSVSPVPHVYGKRSLCRDQFETTLDILGKNALESFETFSQDESWREFIQSIMMFQEHLSPSIAAELKEAYKQFLRN